MENDRKSHWDELADKLGAEGANETVPPAAESAKLPPPKPVQPKPAQKSLPTKPRSQPDWQQLASSLGLEGAEQAPPARPAPPAQNISAETPPADTPSETPAADDSRSRRRSDDRGRGRNRGGRSRDRQRDDRRRDDAPVAKPAAETTTEPEQSGDREQKKPRPPRAESGGDRGRDGRRRRRGRRSRDDRRADRIPDSDLANENIPLRDDEIEIVDFEVGAQKTPTQEDRRDRESSRDRGRTGRRRRRGRRRGGQREGAPRTEHTTTRSDDLDDVDSLRYESEIDPEHGARDRQNLDRGEGSFSSLPEIDDDRDVDDDEDDDVVARRDDADRDDSDRDDADDDDTDDDDADRDESDLDDADRDESDLEDGDESLDEERPNHKGIPTWAETIGMIIANNMAARAKSPGNDGGRGRGRRGRRRS